MCSMVRVFVSMENLSREMENNSEISCESSNILEGAECSTLLSPPLDKCSLDSTELCSAESSDRNLYFSFFDKSNDECLPVSWFRKFLAEHDKLWNMKIADQKRILVNDRKYTLKHLYLKIEQLQSSHRELEIQMARMADDKRNEIIFSEFDNSAGLDTNPRSDKAVMTFLQHEDACVSTNDEELKSCSRETEKMKVEPRISSSDVSRKSEKYEKIVHLNKQVCELNLKLKSKDIEIKELQNEVERMKMKLCAKNRTEPKKVERIAVWKKEGSNVRPNAKVESKILNKSSLAMKSCSSEINDKTNLTVDNSEQSKRCVRRSAAAGISNGKSSTAAKENKISREDKFPMKFSHLTTSGKKKEGSFYATRPFHLIIHSLVLLNYMLSILLCRVLTLLCGGLYPAYRSFKALKSKNGREHVKWMMYWIVFAVFLNLETLADIFLGIWLPFYYEMKMWFILWLLLPYTRGSTVLYRKFIHPILERHENDIEEYLSQAKHQGYTTLVKLGTRGVLYAREVVASVALKGQEHLVNQLRKSYSVGDLANARDFNQTDSESVNERVWTGYYDDGNQLVEEEFDYLYEGGEKENIGEDSSSLERTRTMTTRRRAQATGVQPPAYSTLPRRRRRDGTL
ncbi:Uncharacterized protein T4B_9141 [Trichinella pseudospiralis]|uniref:Receptor expression-enhancing protein n=1 Tax=Trichinella pseudospiralis TaxID=6337 RepID=A0A0V1J125_TRIPS|nr:Uncharacterized protein T4B_9141 [Trichinella pseudospiralis]